MLYLMVIEFLGKKGSIWCVIMYSIFLYLLEIIEWRLGDSIFVWEVGGLFGAYQVFNIDRVSKYKSGIYFRIIYSWLFKCFMLLIYLGMFMLICRVWIKGVLGFYLLWLGGLWGINVIVKSEFLRYILVLFYLVLVLYFLILGKDIAFLLSLITYLLLFWSIIYWGWI
uniref:Uncharacterized protein n=1 Tax=Sphaerothecum destruens TaxID=42893 RepID=A0A6H2U2M8_9EUKA|nr:hypothetical protein [Sphaerothecum destruens]QID02692.1 hypothetical protein [Sphaerothecum destruens]